MKSLVNGMQSILHIQVHPILKIFSPYLYILETPTSIPSHCKDTAPHPSTYHHNDPHNSPRCNPASPTNHPPLKHNFSLRTLSNKSRILRAKETPRPRETGSKEENHGRAGRGASPQNVWSRRGWRRSWCRVGGWPGTFD